MHGAIDRGYEKRGFVFTTNPGGAFNSAHWNAWSDVDYSPLSGAHVILTPDPDGPGAAWCEGIAACLRKLNGSFIPPTFHVGTIPPLSEYWHNGGEPPKPWGFGDPTPAVARPGDIDKILNNVVHCFAKAVNSSVFPRDSNLKPVFIQVKGSQHSLKYSSILKLSLLRKLLILLVSYSFSGANGQSHGKSKSFFAENEIYVHRYRVGRITYFSSGETLRVLASRPISIKLGRYKTQPNPACAPWISPILMF